MAHRTLFLVSKDNLRRGMMPRLPPDLSDRIIDNLHDDELALSACSLTSRSWLPAARYHRFGRISLYWQQLQAFDLLLDATPEIGAYITSLTLEGALLRGTAAEDMLSSVTVRLPAVKHFKLFLSGMSGRASKILANHFNSLQSLELVMCVCYQCGDLVPLIVSSPSLERITLQDLGCEVNDFDGCQNYADALMPCLEELRLGSCSYAAKSLYEWLISHSGTRIETLFLRIMGLGDAYYFSELMHRAGNKLRELEILVDSEPNIAEQLHGQGFALEPATSLRVCTLNFKLREMLVPENRSLPWITTLMTQISSPFIETIIISIQVDHERDLRVLDSERRFGNQSYACFDDMQALDWEKVNEWFLDGDKHDVLKEIVLQGIGDPSQTDQFLQEKYPELHSHISLVTVIPHRN